MFLSDDKPDRFCCLVCHRTNRNFQSSSIRENLGFGREAINFVGEDETEDHIDWISEASEGLNTLLNVRLEAPVYFEISKLKGSEARRALIHSVGVTAVKKRALLRATIENKQAFLVKLGQLMRGCLVERNVDYSNRVSSSKKVNAKQMKRAEIHQKENMPFSSQEYAEKLQKENMTLMKALAHRNKIIELSGVEFQKLRINLRNVQEKNLQLAQANSQMLAELNTNRDRLKQFQHELGCKNGLLNAMKMQLEEQILPCTHHGSKDKVPANVSDGDCKPFQTQDLNQKATKRKRTSRIKPSGSSNDKPIHTNENTNSKRKISVVDTTGIPEDTCQTEDDIEKGVVSRGENQTVDNVVNKKFVLDPANLIRDSVHSKRQCVRRQSTRFDVQETEQMENLLERVDTQETEEARRPSLRRRSARLRPEEGETCKSIHERDEVRETIKRRRVSTKKQSASFDFQEPEVTETLNADDAESLVSEESLGSRSEAVEPSENRNDKKETDVKQQRRVSMRRQSAKGKSQATKEIAITNPSLGKNIVQDCDHETESKKKPRSDENEGMIRRTSVGRPSRHAAEKVQSYREVSLKVKMRREC